jgi:NADPH2:quinone reductase
MADGRLDGQIELEASWREPSRALDALLERRVGGKAVLTSTDLALAESGIRGR